MPFEYTYKSKHDPEMFRTILFGGDNNKSISGRANMSTTTNSWIEYLFN